MEVNNGFPWEISLEDSWFEWEYQQFKEALKNYQREIRVLTAIEHKTTLPIPCKSWIKDYYCGDEPANLATLWGEIDKYIKEQESKQGWRYSHLGISQVDVNTDPYDDYENLTDKYTVYAKVENPEDFKESEEYKSQESLVKHYYDVAMDLKQRIDDRLKDSKGE